MRTAARVTLALVLLMGGLFVLPRPASRVVSPDALAQVVPTPTVPDIFNSPKPSPSPSETSGGGGDPGGDPGGDGNEPGNEDPNKPGKTKDGGKKDGPGKKAKGGKKGAKGKLGLNGGKKKKKGKKDKTAIPDGPVPSGTFGTDRLVDVANRLRALGLPADAVAKKVFTPFIIAGEAAWTNTWHAARYGPAPGQVRLHEGQDVFCRFGAPLLATESGVIEFDDGGLGGKVARLHRSDGSYWYYAHLSDWNTQEFSSGDRVVAGDIIGYCGNSGNALTTPPHVHFGLYLPNGQARNTHKALVAWLRAAEARSLGQVAQATRKRVKRIVPLTAARRFGDMFLPDRSELDVSSRSLLASGSYPASGAFALAEMALQEALSRTTFGGDQFAQTIAVAQETPGPGTLNPDSALGQLLAGVDSVQAIESAD